MTSIRLAQPDVTLLLDLDGVIRQVSLADGIPGEGLQALVGRSWAETVGDVGGDKIRRMIEDARASGVSGFRQVNQRFPNGLEMPVEYTTVRLGGKAGLMAIGKSLEAVAELQGRLVATQQALERDYWKLREVETRYRLLFNASSEAVLLVRSDNLRIVEANRAALQALDLAPARREGPDGREFLDKVAESDREALLAMLARVREQGQTPGILVHFGADRKPWLVRASLMSFDPGPVLMLQLAPVGAGALGPARSEVIAVEDLIERAPDGFVVIDQDGIVRRANRAFLELIEVGGKGSVIGERLGRWLWRPGADLAVLLANVQRYGVVRLFSTTIHGELGGDTEVEISAAGNTDSGAPLICVLIRDVGRRIAAHDDGNKLIAALGSISEQIGKQSLGNLVKDTIGILERHYVKAALDIANGNRTAAAELLGLSRQSLYAKLHRYGFDKDRVPAADRGD